MSHSRLISPDATRRSPPPENVWDYIRFDSWNASLGELLADQLDNRVRREFLCHPPEYIVSDDLSWLDDIIRCATGRDGDIKSLTAERIASRYRFMRAAHATRTEQVASFYENGLIPLNPDQFHARAEEIFLCGAFPELSRQNLDTAINNVRTDLREGRVYFEANETGLLNDAGHYLLYGGEYLIALAAHLGGIQDYRQALKRFGQPTMFVCDVPIAMIGERTLLSFAGCALEAMFERLLEANYQPSPHRGAGFCIHEPLPPSAIVGHYHPAKIRDPLLRYRVVA